MRNGDAARFHIPARGRPTAAVGRRVRSAGRIHRGPGPGPLRSGRAGGRRARGRAGREVRVAAVANPGTVTPGLATMPVGGRPWAKAEIRVEAKICSKSSYIIFYIQKPWPGGSPPARRAVSGVRSPTGSRGRSRRSAAGRRAGRDVPAQVPALNPVRRPRAIRDPGLIGSRPPPDDPASGRRRPATRGRPVARCRRSPPTSVDPRTRPGP